MTKASQQCGALMYCDSCRENRRRMVLWIDLPVRWRFRQHSRKRESEVLTPQARDVVARHVRRSHTRPPQGGRGLGRFERAGVGQRFHAFHGTHREKLEVWVSGPCAVPCHAATQSLSYVKSIRLSPQLGGLLPINARDQPSHHEE